MTFKNINLVETLVVKSRPSVSYVAFISCCCIGCYGCMFAFVVLDVVFQFWAKRLAGKNVSLKLSVLCQVGCKTLTQSTCVCCVCSVTWGMVITRNLVGHNGHMVSVKLVCLWWLQYSSVNWMLTPPNLTLSLMRSA